VHLKDRCKEDLYQICNRKTPSVSQLRLLIEDYGELKAATIIPAVKVVLMAPQNTSKVTFK